MSHRLQRSIIIAIGILISLVCCACLHAMQETTCKTKFKKKYNCPFKEIHMVDDELDMGDRLKLRGCGKTVTYEGTEEILVED